MRATEVAHKLVLVFLASGCSVDARGLEPVGSAPDDGSPPPVAQPDASSEAPNTDPPQADGSTDMTADAGTEELCPTHGSFALTLEADVDWAGTSLFGIVPIILPGEGKVVIHTLVEIAPPASSGSPTQVRACAAEVPDFAASVGELYGGDFADQVWDRTATRWSTQAFFACPDAGCAFRSDLVTAQLGLTLPTTTTWPTPRDELAMSLLRDDDGDGRPGVPLRLRGPKDNARYTLPPTSYLLLERVREIDLAIRVGASLDGVVDSCDDRSGAVKGMTLELRALGCQLEGGRPCRPDEASFVDDNLPVWKVRAARFRAARLAAGATCVEARGFSARKQN